MLTNPSADSLLFLIEFETASSPGPRYSRSYHCRKVSLARFNQEMQNIHRQGGTILSITPASRLKPPLLRPNKFAWWIEIYTDFPRCLYYFGPFDSEAEAQGEQAGFIEDLKQEGVEQLSVQTKQCEPGVLTQEWWFLSLEMTDDRRL